MCADRQIEQANTIAAMADMSALRVPVNATANRTDTSCSESRRDSVSFNDLVAVVEQARPAGLGSHRT